MQVADIGGGWVEGQGGTVFHPAGGAQGEWLRARGGVPVLLQVRVGTGWVECGWRDSCHPAGGAWGIGWGPEEAYTCTSAGEGGG
jgi:hypothetical protein